MNWIKKLMMFHSSRMETLIRKRRTIHNFHKRPIPDIKDINKAIELAQLAPNHHLTEPWHFYHIGPETKEAICLLNYECMKEKKDQAQASEKLQRWRDMPGWLLVTCDHSDDELRKQEDYAAVACAIQNFSLYLWSKGIGCKWSTGGVIRDMRFYDLVWVDPKQEYVVGLLWYGYAQDIPQVPRSNPQGCIVELP